MFRTADQIEAIHTMLSSGHRSVRLERHTLVLWGLVGAFLCIAVDALITPERFANPWQLAVVELLFIGGTLLIAGFADFRLTRRARRARYETLPFVQHQVTKVWWLLMAMGVAMTFGMHFYGGGYMVFSAWLVLIGLALYVHGLFSDRILEWGGMLIIVLAIAAIGLQLPYEAMRWLAASVLGVGMPLLAWAHGRRRSEAWPKRLAFVSLWVAAVAAPAAAAYQAFNVVAVPPGVVVPLDAFRTNATAGPQVVTIPAGAEVPVRIRLRGNMTTEIDAVALAMTLTKPLDVALVDGELEGRFRVEDGPWRARQSGMRLRVEKVSATLTPAQGPEVQLDIHMLVDP